MMGKRSKGQTVLLYLAVVVVFLWTIVPFYWMVLASVSPTVELLSPELRLIPENPSFNRYAAILFNKKIAFMGGDISSPTALFKRAMLNSFYVASATTLIGLLLGSLTAYAFARLRMFLREPLLMLALFVQMLPPIAIVIPLYLIFKTVGLMDHIGTLVLIYTSFVLVYVIWIMTGYFRSIPPDLEDAARIDGCSRLGAFWRVMVPVAKPGFVATGTLAFLLSWDEFMYALIFTNSMNAKTLPVAISEFSTQYGTNYGMMLTGGVLATVIPLLLALAFQRYIISGLTAGAVKG